MKAITDIDGLPVYGEEALAGPKRLLIYSRNGVGKTFFACGAPDVLVLDIEGGAEQNLAGRGGKIVRIDSLSKFETVLEWLSSTKHSFKTVVLDSLTHFQGLAMGQILFVESKKSRIPGAGELAKAVDKYPAYAFQAHYGITNDAVKRAAFLLHKLPYDLIFICQEKNLDGAQAAKEEIGIVPDLYPGSRSYVGSVCDIIGRLTYAEEEKTGVVRFLKVGPSEVCLTKNRGGVLPAVVKNPDAAKILNALKGVKNNGKGK